VCPFFGEVGKVGNLGKIDIMKEVLKQTHFCPFFCALSILQIVKHAESLASKRGTKCTSKCPEMHGSVILTVFVHQKVSPEPVKRDPHLFDLVIFLHPKKCLTCGRETLCVPFGSGKRSRNLGSFFNVLRNIQNQNSEWFLAFLQLFVGL